jgi:hypothetical protein
MFPANLIRHKNSELFFAIVAPVGADVETACNGLEQVLNRFNYDLYTVRLIEELKRVCKSNAVTSFWKTASARIGAMPDFPASAMGLDAWR